MYVILLVIGCDSDIQTDWMTEQTLQLVIKELQEG